MRIGRCAAVLLLPLVVFPGGTAALAADAGRDDEAAARVLTSGRPELMMPRYYRRVAGEKIARLRAENPPGRFAENAQRLARRCARPI